ncbi:MAG: hypothetical protein SGPRY_000696 [Prymnesium sp.]
MQKRFLANFNALARKHSDRPIRVTGSLRRDNACEFISREFSELLDEDIMVAGTNCPPHVYQLNRVAEGAIRSILGLARSYLSGANVDSTFWPFAIEMAVDVLNWTSGPTAVSEEGPSSYELLTGARPRVLSIPCRSCAACTRSNHLTSTLRPHSGSEGLGEHQPRPQRQHSMCIQHLPASHRTTVEK